MSYVTGGSSVTSLKGALVLVAVSYVAGGGGSAAVGAVGAVGTVSRPCSAAVSYLQPRELVMPSDCKHQSAPNQHETEVKYAPTAHVAVAMCGCEAGAHRRNGTKIDESCLQYTGLRSAT